MDNYYAKVIADSVSALWDVRLTTLEVRFPRFILAEFNTHRMFSRNSASSRAIPVHKRIEQVRTNPFVPEAFALNKRGMQAGVQLTDEEAAEARRIWLEASELACNKAEELMDMKVHKQWANRLIEPYVWHTVVVTSTEWDNFFLQRDHEDAQPEMQITAKLMREALNGSTPVRKDVGEWHLPYIQEDEQELPDDILVRVSSARSARTSYLTQGGIRDQEEDLGLYHRLRQGRHMSPHEHVARVVIPEGNAFNMQEGFYGNFRMPWWQHRKDIPGEDGIRV